MPHTVHAFDWLDHPTDPPAVCVLFGDSPFLKRRVRKLLAARVLDGDLDAPFAVFDGDATEWRDVHDELATRSLFGAGGRRLAIVEDADDFVSKHRDRLEKYVAQPHAASTLVLEVETWVSNTRLYKLIDQTGLQIECKPPQKSAGKNKVVDDARLRKWVVDWAAKQHHLRLDAAAADQLLALVGPEFGLLDQNLAKLALFADRDGRATALLVAEIVGGWQAQTTWELVDAAADGNAAEALKQLDHLLQSGEAPPALFAQISWSLRRFAAAARIYELAERQGRRIPIREALIQAGVSHWNQVALDRAENQIKQLGRERAGELYYWLLQTDLALKGSHSADQRARLALERLLLRMARR